MTFAVGSLVTTRGREWVVLPGSDADAVRLRPVGGTEDEVTSVLTVLEPVEPAQFDLPDPRRVGDEASARLLRAALRLGFRSSAGPFRSFGQIAVTPRPYQLVPLLMALRLDPVRLLIADDVGIGKTVEALLIARELLDQGDIERTAVLCAPHLAEQWQAEMAGKFALDAEVVLPGTVRRLERRCRPHQSLFEVYPHVIVSTDFVKSDRRRDDFLRTCPEFVIVDEAHSCAAAGARAGGRHQRHELVKGLSADRSRHLVLVTATPHSGNEDAFRSLLGLLDPELGALPDDLSGPANERHRRVLAAHLVQRRRADITTYLHEDTPFPRRETAEATYQLTREYRALFDRVVAYARETVADGEGGATRQRVRWWSALALLRALASSPAAAAETLRNRAAAADAGSDAEADELGRSTVLDLAPDDATETMDVTPGADYSQPEQSETRVQRRLRDFERQARALEGDGDAKLAAAVPLVRRLLGAGHSPILFCRFIPTAEYLAAELRARLGRGVEVAAVTGLLPPAEREQRVRGLAERAAPGRRVLVATDCLSEGINLQDAFDAVVHYDLAWNPTRHEQREGRVDRFGQPRDVVRTVTFYGADNPIDGIVLDVLLRKHQRIRSALGISVPVPGDTNRVVEAIFEGLLLRGGGAQPEQLRLEGVAEPERAELFSRWEDAAAREQRSRTMFAQESIKVDEVAGELQAVRDAIGADSDVETFTVDALRAHGAVVRGGAVTEIDLSEVPRAVRDALPGEAIVRARFTRPLPPGTELLTRTHGLVQGLAAHTLDAALDPLLDGPASRCGVIRTRAVARRTTLLLVRYRFHLVVARGGAERPLFAEDARLLAFAGPPEAPEWLPDADAERLLTAAASANVPPELAVRSVQQVLDGFAALRPALDADARVQAERLLTSHRTVREASGARSGVRYRVEPQLPPDVLGCYLYLPVPALAGGTA